MKKKNEHNSLHFKKAVATMNLALKEGPIRTLNVGLSDEQFHTLECVMVKNLYHTFRFLDNRKYTVPEKELGFNMLFGRDWNDYDITPIREELLKNGIVLDELTGYCSFSDEEKVFMQTLTRGVVHYVYRNNVIEDYHADMNTNLTDEYMKEINIYIMNVVGLILEQNTYNGNGIKNIINAYTDNINEYLHIDLSSTKETKSA